MLARPRSRVIGVAVALSLLSAGLVVGADPANANGVPYELNSDGGDQPGEGLHIYYGGGQTQVTRDGDDQFTGDGVLPAEHASAVMGLLNGIYLRVGNVLVGPQHSAIDDVVGTTVEWDRISTTGGSSTDGTITATLEYSPVVASAGARASVDPEDATYTVVLTMDYDDVTHEYYHETVQVTVSDPPVSAAVTTVPRLYRVIDTRLDGSTFGAGFRDTTGDDVVGVVNPGQTRIEAFRYTAGPAWDGWWSGETTCMYSDDCAMPLSGYLNTGASFTGSNDNIAINDDPTTDNGIGIMWNLVPPVVSSGVSAATMDPVYTFDYDVIVGAREPNVITFTKPPDTPLADGSIEIPSDGDWGGQIEYQSATPSVCSVAVVAPTAIRASGAGYDPTTIDFVTSGTCTIHADQPAYQGHGAATRITRSFLVTVPSPPGVPPTPSALTSTGKGGALQQVSVPLSSGNTVTLMNAGQPASTVTVTGGAYSIAAGVITFTPSAGYVGTPSAVTFRVTNADGLTGTATYTPTVTKPAPPVPVARVSTGDGTQHVTIAVGAGESLTLLDAGGVATGTVTVAGEGSYSLDAAAGVITFSPEEGFLGAASGVTYRLSDTYEQSGTAVYTPTVTDGPIPTPTPTPTPDPTPPPVPKPPVVKPLPEINRTKLVKIPANPKAVKGKEKKTKAFNSSFTGVDAHPITKLGTRKLVKGEAATLSGDGLFGFDSGKLTKKGRAEVKAVVKNLKGTKSVHCEGYTDYAGDRSHELDLSLQRAKAVCSALRKYGAKVITMTRGYGPKRPAVVGGTPKSRKENRRVVILVTK